MPARSLTKNRYSAICLLCCLVAVGVLLTSLSISVAGGNSNFFTTWFGRGASVPGDQGNNKQFGVTRITFQPWGLEPRQITVPKGLLLLAIENRSGIVEPKFELLRETGREKVKDIHMKKSDSLNKRGSHKLYQEAYDLPPGRYLLTSTDNPVWVCSIEISNQ
jgi:hypothetical protein